MDTLLPRLFPDAFVRIAWRVAPVALVLFAAGDANAFCRSTTCQGANCETDENECPISGKPLFWKTACVSYSFQKDGTQDLPYEQTQLAVNRAFAAWNNIDCEGGKASINFAPTDLVECKKSEYNKEGPNLNVVLFQDDDWTYRGIDGTLAKTSVTSNQETGEIYDADIEVNAANQELTITDKAEDVRFDLQAILTHEVGHFLGIAHSADPSATMYRSYDSGQTSQRYLTQDDRDALCAIYPTDRAAVCDPEPLGGFSATCRDADENSGGCSMSSPDRTSTKGAVILLSCAIGATTILIRRRRNR